MPELAIKVPDFEGPLDLLIHLIEKDKLDIYDIPIASVTEQYINYLHTLQEFDMEVATGFVVMAAMLLQIKSRMLLPKEQRSDNGEEEADPRQMLVEMLVEYRRVKAHAAALLDLYHQARHFHTRRPLFAGKVEQYLHHYPVGDLFQALVQLMSARGSEIAYVERQEFDVGQKMDEIVALLTKHEEGLEFKAAFARTGTVSEQVASFLAVLELLKLKVVRISQGSAFAPIYLFLRQGEDCDVAGL
jgi:segregation and condensation protein A